MNTTIYKSKSVIGSPINLKYEVVLPYDAGNVRLAFIDAKNAAVTNTLSIEVVSYNGELTKSSPSSAAITLTLNSTVQEGDDTIRKYTLDVSGSSNYAFAEISYPATTSKVMVEAIDGVDVMNITNAYYIKDNALLHARKSIWPYPDEDVSTSTVFNNSILFGNFVLRDTSEISIDSVKDVLQYYNLFMPSAPNLTGDILTIAENINVNLAMMGNKSEYSGIRVTVNNSKVTGSVMEFFNKIKERRGTKWACQLGVSGCPGVINDSPISSLASLNCKCDENGNFTFYTSLATLVSAVPTNPV